METQVFTAEEIEDAAALIKAGEVVAFPTETVYGLGADATNPAAVQKVFDAKHRPADNPLIVTVDSIERVSEFATVTKEALDLMNKFWPGPLTIILPILPGRLSKIVTGGLETAAFRMPANPLTRELIKTADTPIVGPSANLSGKPSATTVEHVLNDFEDAIAGVLDDGPTTIGVESTVIDMTAQPPAILRPGELDETDLVPVIGQVQTDTHKVGAKETPKAPGMKYKHYAPNAQVIIIDDPEDWGQALGQVEATGRKYGVLASDTVLTAVPVTVPTYSLGEDVTTAAHALFAGLRWFDGLEKVELILAESFPEEGVGRAYMNRLRKSAGDRHFSGLQSDWL